MCDLWNHECPECGVEVKCYLPNHECATFNGLQNDVCGNCEKYYEELENYDRPWWEKDEFGEY